MCVKNKNILHLCCTIRTTQSDKYLCDTMTAQCDKYLCDTITAQCDKYLCDTITAQCDKYLCGTMSAQFIHSFIHSFHLFQIAPYKLHIIYTYVHHQVRY